MKKRWNGGKIIITPRKTPVQLVIERQQVAVLDLVQHQEAVVLADHVIVGPDAHQQRQQSLLPGQHHQRAQREEDQQAAVEQLRGRARELRGSKYVRLAVAKMCVPSKPTLQNHHRSEIFTWSAV